MLTPTLTVDPQHPDEAAIARAAECLRAGGLVAFPTETVYGLGAHALDRAAVRRIFEAKGRPAHDPLIVHVADVTEVDALVSEVPEAAHTLGAKFWPGPLTLVMRRRAAVPDEVTAGLDTVAIRVPAHPVARALLRAAGIPVAAPSANLFSRPSPTRASHVREDLDGRIDLIVDGGPTTVGLESTVVDLTGSRPTVLRPGAITLEMLREVMPSVMLRDAAATAESTDGALPSPGLLSKHYAPRAPLVLYEGDAQAVRRALTDAIREGLAAGQRVGLLATRQHAPAQPANGVVVAELAPDEDPHTIAARLYAALRELDAAGVDVILAAGIASEAGLGRALRDRLHRAAHRTVSV